MIHLHNATLHNPKRRDIYRCWQAMDELLQDVEEVIKTDTVDVRTAVYLNRTRAVLKHAIEQ